MQKSIKDSLRNYNEQYARDRVNQDKLDLFSNYLAKYANDVRVATEFQENEEYYKALLNSFLKNIFYNDDRFSINTDGYIDSAIKDNGNLRVIIETKTLRNRAEFPKNSSLVCKGLCELILYYLKATRNVEGEKVRPQYGVEVRRLVLTNSMVWYFFDANDIERLCSGEIERLYFKFAKKQLHYADNQNFYNEIKELLLNKQVDDNLDYLKVDVNDYIGTNGKLVANSRIDLLYKLFDYHFLLKESYSNLGKTHVLNTQFYKELLYIMGLKEAKEKGKPIIVLDHTIENSMGWQLYRKYTEDKEYSKERSTEGTLELMILWIDRLLFIKLFEGQLISFNEDKPEFQILSQDKIHSFKELQSLFFSVLGKKVRSEDSFYLQFSEIPYLNSSLFERQEIEKDDYNISDLDNAEVKLAPGSVLKKKGIDKLPLLDYIVSFLASYDFGANGTEQGGIKQGKDIIDASVLGLIFEKINGYKDGSFYTPSYITEYIAKEVIEKLVVDKLNVEFSWGCNSYDSLKFMMSKSLSIEVIDRANAVINSLRIVDPAVGSGHFLVSALNRLLAVKYDLGIIKIHGDSTRVLSNVDIYIQDDTLVVSDAQGDDYKYDKNDRMSQNVQETLFEEKRTLIQNCLYGVDINPKAVAICQLRLWIELLKNAYYKKGIMETLPNIDINIKTGNSLVSTISYKQGNVIGRTKSDADIETPLKKIDQYRALVREYQYIADKEKKEEIKESIDSIKHNIRAQLYHQGGMIFSQDRQYIGINYGENIGLFNEAYEWAFEFPEVVSDEGRFIGFDCVIGNPPYGVSLSDSEKEHYKKVYSDVHVRTPDSYNYFISLGLRLLKTNAVLAYIVPNTLLFQNEYEKARNLLLDGNTLNKVINMGDNVFDRADVPTCIIFVEKKYSDSYDILYADFRSKRSDDAPLGEYDTILHNKAVLDTPSYVLGVDDIGKQILDMVKEKSIPLSNVASDVSSGISTGNNDVFCVKKEYAERKGFEQDMIKPMLAGKDIDCYETHWDEIYIIYSTKDTQTPDHPITYQYLEPHEEVLSKKRETRKGLIPWYSLHWPRNRELFLGPKIVMRQTSDRIRATYDDSDYYALDSVILLKLNPAIDYSYLFVLAIMNSSLNNFIYMLLTQEKGRGYPQVKPKNIKKLYIPLMGKEQQSLCEDLVSRLLRGELSKSEGMSTIDEMIYDFYGLDSLQRDYIEEFIEK